MATASGRRRWPYVGVVVLVVFALAAFTLWGVASKFDYGHLFARASWQLPAQVINTLDIQPGDHVADIGAGDGYFTFMLADAVGPTGIVYAVDVTDASVATLRAQAKAQGYTNVVVIKGELADPLLPDGKIDLVFLSNSFHHIDDRPLYFNSLRTDLSGSGRVAIIEPKPIRLVRVLSPAGHWSSLASIEEDMVAATYHSLGRFEFLPIQHFVTFAPTWRTASPSTRRGVETLGRL